MSAVINHGAVRLDLAAQTVTVDGKEVLLTTAEYKVFQLLMLNAGNLIDRGTINLTLYGIEDFIAKGSKANCVEVFISRLRKKLKTADAPDLILTIRSRGYRIDLPRAEAA